MAFKTIFTALSDFDRSSPALSMATALTDAQDGHLEVMCLGLDRIQTTFYEIGSNAMIMQAAIEEAHEKAHALSRKVSDYLQTQNIRWDVINGVGNVEGVAQTVAPRARFADLAVLDLPYGDECKAEDSLVLEAMLFSADCPTLVVPKGDFAAAPKKVIVAWNESAEAMHAARLALPFLKAADEVHIAIIDPPQLGPDRSDPGGPLAVYLFRHGITCDIQVMTSGGKPVSDRLSQYVTEAGGDLLVMGGYGHSRFREAILGGATRDMLEHAKVPVFMAH